MSREFSFDVFLSHSTNDSATARDLARRLQADGLRVWFDEFEVKPGDMAAIKVEQGLSSSKCLVLMMSSGAFGSEWSVLERQTAQFRDPTNSNRRFIPVRLDNAEVKESIKHFASIDLRQRSASEYAKLLASCNPVDDKANVELAIKATTPHLGHTSRINSVALSVDGRRAISAHSGKTIRVWDVARGRRVCTLDGHADSVSSVALSGDGRIVLSGSRDKTVRIWDVETSRCLKTLEGHTDEVTCVAMSRTATLALSGSLDGTIRVWDLKAGQCLRILSGHSGKVSSVAMGLNPRRAVSAADSTLQVWDLDAGLLLTTLEGHTGPVNSVAVSADSSCAVSGSDDLTVRVWDLGLLRCVFELEGHTGGIRCVALSGDGRLGISGSEDSTMRVWATESGHCIAMLDGHSSSVSGVAITSDADYAFSGGADGVARVWPLQEIREVALSTLHLGTQYTNAKVVLMGDTGVGKTGLALRLGEDRWEPTESTHGMVISQLKFVGEGTRGNFDREVWLWDFAGQPDYRLIHQLYMDETALGVMVFDPQDDNPFEDISYWDKALQVASRDKGIRPKKMLVAARCDRGGITVSRKRFDQFCVERDFVGLWLTGAKTGEGCSELREAIAKYIPWEHLPYTSTTRLFKSLKDALLKLKEQGTPIIRLPELRQHLQLMMPGAVIGAGDLRAVVGLMQGQGIVQMLDFGDFVLLQPEQINRYASVVVRMAREHSDEIGVVLEQSVLEGLLDYKGMARLSDVDEKILLRAMVQTFLDRALCLRESTPAGTMLVFPSYFRRDKPDLPEYPNVFVTYGFSGPIDEIYATLVVKLSYSDGFIKDQLWKDAADFRTHSGKRVGLALRRAAESSAELMVYFEPGVPDDTKVTFIKYVHEHLSARVEDVTRVRTYVCPHCDTPLENRTAIQLRIRKGLRDILCGACENRVQLVDLIEEKFASQEFRQRVREMEDRARVNLDNESKELILVGHAFAVAGEAGQIYRQYTNSDHGIDGEIEFKDYSGRASGKRVYLQLKSGDSYLYARKVDGAEIFAIKKERWAEYWQKQGYPVMLVVRTSDGQIRWMNITDALQKKKKKQSRIVFTGEPFTALSVGRLRDAVLEGSSQVTENC